MAALFSSDRRSGGNRAFRKFIDHAFSRFDIRLHGLQCEHVIAELLSSLLQRIWVTAGDYHPRTPPTCELLFASTSTRVFFSAEEMEGNVWFVADHPAVVARWNVK
jgi:hypothetical protein